MQPIYLIASGDLRLSANRNCEAAQSAMEQQLARAIEKSCMKPEMRERFSGQGF